MKKLLLFAFLIGLFSISSQAQTYKALPIVAGDTVSTSSSLDTVSKVLQITAGYSSLGIQVKATKVSGTITSKAYLYVSGDGTSTSYVLTDSTAAFSTSITTPQSVYFTKTSPPYGFYKVQVRPPSNAATSEVLAVTVLYRAAKFDR